MQILADVGEELGRHSGLGWIPGTVRRLEASPGFRVPHVGWSGVDVVREHPVFADLGPDATFYYVHSYVLAPENPQHVAATCMYGEPFVCAIAKDNIVATQFHPEKSQRHGFALLKRFASWSP
jgi:glutamine amidotransferase